MRIAIVSNDDFTLEICGDVFAAHGDGWAYEGVGNLRKFTQSKKIPSIRVVKALVKKLIKE